MHGRQGVGHCRRKEACRAILNNHQPDGTHITSYVMQVDDCKSTGVGSYRHSHDTSQRQQKVAGVRECQSAGTGSLDFR